MIIAANWKMNPNLATARLLFQSVLAAGKAVEGQCQVLVFPPACYFSLAESLLGDSCVGWGGQDCHEQETGAFTGDISAGMIADFGGGWVLVGHSERRQYHHEDDQMVAAKLQRALACGLRAVICVGEPADIRDGGGHETFVAAQLEQGLSGLHGLPGDRLETALARLVVAYEPVWAIGTGNVATIHQISAMHRHIHNELERHFCEHLPRTGLPILYGGSVKPDNASDILGSDYVSGALVGGASLDASGFAAICQAAARL